MSAIQPGALVNATIKGVRYIGENERGHAVVADEDNDQFTLPAHAELERVLPAEWPPQVGDLWRDGQRTLWFAVESLRSETSRGPVELTCNGRNRRPAEEVQDLYAPLTLVHREGKVSKP